MLIFPVITDQSYNGYKTLENQIIVNIRIGIIHQYCKNCIQDILEKFYNLFTIYPNHDL